MGKKGTSKAEVPKCLRRSPPQLRKNGFRSAPGMNQGGTYRATERKKDAGSRFPTQESWSPKEFAQIEKRKIEVPGIGNMDKETTQRTTRTEKNVKVIHLPENDRKQRRN